MQKRFELELIDSKMLHSSCRHLVFKRVDGEILEFIAGQFIQVHFEKDGREYRRSYSIASLSSDQIEIAVSYVEGGVASALFSNLEVGNSVQASGPYGRFVLPVEAYERCFLVATGTGVTPYRAMIPQLKERLVQLSCEVRVLFGCRRPEEALYHTEFEHMALTYSNFYYSLSFSQEQRKDPKSHEHAGRLQTQLNDLSPNPETDIVYLCGNPDMIDEAVIGLKEKEFPIKNIRREKYISPK